MVYTTSNDGIGLIKHFEGCKLSAYICPAGICTIGYGHTRTAKIGQTITAERAEQLLRDDLLSFERGVNRAVTVPLKQHQFDALVSFAFNAGIGALEGSTLLRKVNAEAWAEAALQFDRWVHGGGKRLPGLVRRRAAERAMFEGREWTA